MKCKEHIKEFPELEKRWNSIPEATKALFEIQIDAFANGIRANKYRGESSLTDEMSLKTRGYKK